MDYTEVETMIEQMMQDPMYQKMFMISMIISFSIALALELLVYILGAIGVRRLSATAGLAHPGLAFVPILRWMMLGKLAELPLPREKRVRKVFAYSVHLPIVMTLSTILSLVYSTYQVYYMLIAPDQEPTVKLEALMSGVDMAFSVISMIATVLMLLALYRVFSLIGHQSPMMLTILCALITFCLPIFLFVYRKKSIGVPPASDENDHDSNHDDSGFYYDGK